MSALFRGGPQGRRGSGRAGSGASGDQGAGIRDGAAQASSGTPARRRPISTRVQPARCRTELRGRAGATCGRARTAAERSSLVCSLASRIIVYGCIAGAPLLIWSLWYGRTSTIGRGGIGQRVAEQQQFVAQAAGRAQRGVVLAGPV